MSDMTTTPISEPITAPEIEATFGDGELTDAGRGPAVSIIDEWRRFGAFLKRPTLDVCSQDRGAFTVIARIYALDIAAMAVLVGLASALVAMGVYIPETALAGMEFTLPIILMVVIGAPVMEELAFRGWLSGKPGPVLALFLLGAGGTAVALVHAASPAGGAFAGLASLAAAGLALFFLWRRPAMGWFAKIFPFFF
jgi:membrane protease YdiL (CAAX protease family)